MFGSLKRINIHPKLINIIESLYKKTLFIVEIEGERSEWMEQHTGIRQGCPLSPYLFITVMTIMIMDVKREIQGDPIKHRIPGAEFDEVMYADDTLCISEDTRTMNKFIKQIEDIGLIYGLKLNKRKCELLTTERDPNIHFQDGTKIQKKDTVKYLGCNINKEGNCREEIGKKIANAMATLQKLHIFWRRSNCPIAYKIIALDATIRAKVLYGMDSLQLNEPQIKRLEKIHLQAMRKILKWDSTYINRNNTNKKIYDEVHKRLKEEKKNKIIYTFAEIHKREKLKKIKKLTIRSREEIHEIIFQENLKPRLPPNRTKGRPKFQWADRAVRELWAEIQTKHTQYAHKIKCFE